VRRVAASLAAIVLAVAVSLSLTGCDDGDGDSQTTPGPTVTAALQPTSVPMPQDRRPWSFQGQRGITVAFPPADVGLYRSLLPESFDMPDQPLVAVIVVDYYDVTLPLVPYREGFVALQCEYQGRTGWHVVTMPVDDETSSAGGRSIGFPKYVADEITLEEEGGGWRGRVVHEGRTVMEVAFTATGNAAPSTEGGGTVAFQLLPPGEGPAVYEVNTVTSGERRTVATPGSATVKADAGEPWAGLLGPESATVWASFEEVTGNWRLEPTQLE
jgi:Acetoacetate decarboxylase (ADC)